MYKCQQCQKVVAPNIQSHRVAIETRHKVYPKREKVNRIAYAGRIVHVDDPGGIGFETVREITVCYECACKHGKVTQA